MIDAVIFDVGGVLAKDVWERMYLAPDRGLAARFGLDLGLAKRVGSLLWESFAYVPETPRNDHHVLEVRYWEQFIAFFRDDLRRSASGIRPQYFIEETESFIEPIEGMYDVLQNLQSRGKSLAICSNNNEFWFRRQMDKCNLHRFFSPEKILLSCRIGVPKSSPHFELFDAVTEAVQIPRCRCLLIDDREHNIERAKLYGIEALLFTDVDRLKPTSTKGVFDSDGGFAGPPCLVYLPLPWSIDHRCSGTGQDRGPQTGR